MFADRALDRLRERERPQQLPLATHQRAGHFVDRKHRRDRNAPLHGFNDAVVVFDVFAMPRVHQDQLRA